MIHTKALPMEINEKIRFMREIKGWSQKEMAEKLNMSMNGYANIEKGETNIQYSRLEQISELLGMKLSELTDLDDRNFQIFLECDGNYGNNVSVSSSDEQLQHKLEIAQLKIEQQKMENLHLKQEINHLKEIIELTKKSLPPQNESK